MATSGELEEQLRELRTSLDALPDVAEPPKSTLRILGSADRSSRGILSWRISSTPISHMASRSIS